jgi:hypothetical protein
MPMKEEELRFELTEDDRRDLLAATRTPGYKVMQRILRSYVNALQEGAVAVSLDDPLSTADRIANAWAYAKMARTLTASLEAGIAFELDILQRQENKPDAATLARMRREHFALEAIPAEVNPNVSDRRSTQ